MDHGLKGKVVLVTGSSRGIGASIAEAFAFHGAHVIINYVSSQERAEALAERLSKEFGVDSIAIGADITSEPAVASMMQRIVEEFTVLDVVVNNALPHYMFDPDSRKLAWEVQWEDYQHQLDGSLKGTYLVCRYAIPVMKANGEGRIINMVSDLVYRPLVPYHDYTTAKGALLAFSQNLAADLGSYGILVNCVAPGLVYPTDASRTTKEEVKHMLMAQTPVGRIANPQDVAGSVLFLASQWSSFVTGQCLLVNGGLMMK
jgi:3-oxoacyl-[acyl-carrier protein] reductase